MAVQVIEGYQRIAPARRRDGDALVLDANGVYYQQLNDAIREAVAAGERSIVVDNANGQRYIGTGLRGKDVRIEVRGTAGNDLAAFMDGPIIEVFGNAQDGVGNTMASGKVVVHGDAGDVLGYGMRGGRIFVRGDVGYRVGIHMKAYENLVPVVVCGGKARDFFGEYMAGGMLVLLGMRSNFPDDPIAGSFLGTGMHGGVIYLRGSVEPWRCGREVGVAPATKADMAVLKPVIEEYCTSLGLDVAEVLGAPFTRIAPVSHRPYGKMYAYL